MAKYKLRRFSHVDLNANDFFSRRVARYYANGCANRRDLTAQSSGQVGSSADDREINRLVKTVDSRDGAARHIDDAKRIVAVVCSEQIVPCMIGNHGVRLGADHNVGRNGIILEIDDGNAIGASFGYVCMRPSRIELESHRLRETVDSFDDFPGDTIEYENAACAIRDEICRIRLCRREEDRRRDLLELQRFCGNVSRRRDR